MTRALLLLFACSLPAVCGNVYGTIRENGQPAAGVSATLTCPKEPPSKPSVTEKDGIYRVFSRTTGAGQLTVVSGQRTMSVSVYSYDRPTAYDYDIVRSGNTWSLRKR
jgi:hypothetical protein